MKIKDFFSLSLSLYIYIYIYILWARFIEYAFYGVKKTPIVRIPEIRPTIEIYAPTALNVFIEKR